MKGYIIYATYDNIDDKTFVHLFGRLENKQSFAAINRIKPYFFIKQKDEKKVSSLLEKYKVEKTELKNFSGESVIKISFGTQTSLNECFKALHKKCETYEADIKPHYRFIIDNNLLGSVEIDGDYELQEKVERVYLSQKSRRQNLSQN